MSEFSGAEYNQVPLSGFIHDQRRRVIGGNDLNRIVGKSGRDGN